MSSSNLPIIIISTMISIQVLKNKEKERYHHSKYFDYCTAFKNMTRDDSSPEVSLKSLIMMKKSRR